MKRSDVETFYEVINDHAEQLGADFIMWANSGLCDAMLDKTAEFIAARVGTMAAITMDKGAFCDLMVAMREKEIEIGKERGLLPANYQEPE